MSSHTVIELGHCQTAENLTTSGKCADINIILCDRQTEKDTPPCPSCPGVGSGHAIGEYNVCRSQKRNALGTRRTTRLILLTLGLIFSLGLGGLAQNTGPSEYQIKAAFLYHFAEFVQWPPGTFDGPASPIVVGVLGKNVFGDNLEQTIRNKTINNHPFQFKEFHLVREATNCQILFISPSEEKRLPEILKGLSGTSVLTVSEIDHFTEAGGMINFIIEDDEVRFQINDEAAKKARLIISSKLLTLAAHRR
jgi:YfiR/HmsC-like